MDIPPYYDDYDMSTYGEMRDSIQRGPSRVAGADPGDINHVHDSTIDPDYHRKQARHYHDNQGNPVYVRTEPEQHSWHGEPALYDNDDYPDAPAYYYEQPEYDRNHTVLNDIDQFDDYNPAL